MTIKVLKGKQVGRAMHLTVRKTASENPEPVIQLDQLGPNIRILSALGVVQFFAEDKKEVAELYRKIADMIERQVIVP